MDAVEVRGQRCSGRFMALNSYENRVYQLELDDETMVVGKFYRPGRWSASHPGRTPDPAELAELEIPVAAPLELSPGNTLGEVEGILYALFPGSAGARLRSSPTSRRPSWAGSSRASTTSARSTTRRRAGA